MFATAGPSSAPVADDSGDGGQWTETCTERASIKQPDLLVKIECRKNGEILDTLQVFVVVTDINDNPPVFAQSQYNLDVDELCKVDTSIGKIEATDIDIDTRLYYFLQSPEDDFRLKSKFEPVILTNKILYHDTTPEVTLTLFAQTGALPLEPGPLYAIDGDKDRNDLITYEIIGGNEDGFFLINTETGSITMQKPVNVAGPIILSVMAYETLNSDQFATTSVTLKVVKKSSHPPEFTQPSYEGFISEDAGMGSLVLESKTTNKPLHVQATDADFGNGINPDITFEVPKDSDFRITQEGFIITTRVVSTGNITLQIRVTDTTNDESSTASLSVAITPGISTTTDMPTTAITNATLSTAMVTTPAITTDIATDTFQTTDLATDGLPVPQGGAFSVEEMVALGASMAVVVCLCLVVIGLLAYHLRRSRTNWTKLSEASIFRSTLSGGTGGPKDGVQYTNQGFQSDGDAGSISSLQAAELALPLGPKQSLRGVGAGTAPGGAPAPQGRSGESSSSPQPDSCSLTASDHTDGEKEVKPILTKERRTEDGYKAVWFRQDIDPDVKEEVVIIPDSGQQDNRHDDDEDEEEDLSNTDMDEVLSKTYSTQQNDSDSEDEEGLTTDM
ncbi:cadherin-related family member 5-like isoform X5 [Brachyhypopomus gauderio]|uniref:cadherin-related family member 5-like isoform X5 n=1 Tax=Brachyhypopomus gauderio TaxID=698409 RepID=UPI004040FAE7